MTRLHHHRIRRGILTGLTGILVLPITAAIAPTAAQATTSRTAAPVDLPIVGGAVDSVVGILTGTGYGMGGALGGLLP
jgi:hypothetical protein